VRTPDGGLSSSMFNPTPRRPGAPAATLSRTTLAAGHQLLSGPDPCHIFKLVVAEQLAGGVQPEAACLVHGADGAPLLVALCSSARVALGYGLPRWGARP
jgi:hypothetical protein